MSGPPRRRSTHATRKSTPFDAAAGESWSYAAERSSAGGRSGVSGPSLTSAAIKGTARRREPRIEGSRNMPRTLPPPSGKEQRQGRDAAECRRDPPAPFVELERDADRRRAIVEHAVRAGVTRQGPPEIVRPVRLLRLASHLRLVAVFGEIAVTVAGQEAVADDRLRC